MTRRSNSRSFLSNRRAQGTMLVTLLVAAAVAMLVFPVLTSAINSSTGTQTVTNETVTADVGNYVDLDGYNIVDNSETVYGYNDTSGSYEVATEGTDYELALENGSIKALSGSSLIDDGEDVKVTYDYEATSGTTTLIVGYLPLMVAVLVFTTLAGYVMDQV